MCHAGHPQQPTAVMEEYFQSSGSVKLSWTANLTDGVNHNFTVTVRNVTSSTTNTIVRETVQQPYYVLSRCGMFEIQVQAVNGAGESEPSNIVKVSLPLLPDISPVSNSLSHRVYKYNGEIMVQISFEVSYCNSLVSCSDLFVILTAS